MTQDIDTRIQQQLAELDDNATAAQADDHDDAAAVEAESGLRDDWEQRLEQQDDPCWDGYTMVGLQDDGTPRCVPDEDVDNYDPDASSSAETAQAADVEDCVKSYLDDNPDADKSEAYAICHAQMSGTLTDTAATDRKTASVETKAEFEEGNPVAWDWQGSAVHGRVAEVRDQAATPEEGGQQITGDEDEPVYLIDQWDDRVEAFRRENVAKPESSLRRSQKDMPPRRNSAYVDQQAWDAITTTVHESDFTAEELDHISQEHPDVLQKLDATTWAAPDGEFVYEASVPARYDDIDLTPTQGMQEAAQQAQDAIDEHGNPNDCGTATGMARMRDISNGERLRPDTWREINAWFSRHDEQGAGEQDGREDRTNCQWLTRKMWGGDPGKSRSETVVEQLDRADEETELEMKGAMAARQTVDEITEQDSNRVDLTSLEPAEREAVEADDFYVYGKASIEQWDDDEPPTFIQMDALEAALDRFFESESAPGIISRHHQDIPVGIPVESFEFADDTTLEIAGETYQFEAGDVAESHVQDADGDGRPELWLAANISNDNEMARKTRVLAMRDELDGFSVTVHRNEDELTQEGRVVTDVDLHAVTIGTGDQIKNPGSEFDVAATKGPLGRVRDRVVSFLG